MKKTVLTKSLLFTFLISLMILAMGLTARAATPDPLPTEYVFSTTLALDARMTVGTSKHGNRSVAPITGGSISGSNIQGTVLPAGAGEWKLRLPNFDTELVARYTMQTDDGVLIQVFNKCLVDSSKRYMRCVPSFEAPLGGKYTWLNNAIFLGKLIPAADGRSVTINIFKLK